MESFYCRLMRLVPRHILWRFKQENELRALWSTPDTRKKLLEGLAEKGFGKDRLAEMQKIIDAEK
ncbi:MAG: type I restriction-modification enzyme R subunit C-terminal domain-containing protein, partial [Methylococcales bacterium]